MRADTHEHRGIFPAQLSQRNVRPDYGLAFERYPEIQNALNFRVQHVPGQAIFRNAVAQHPARLTECLKYRDGIAAPRQLIRAGEAGRTGPHHGDLLRALFHGHPRKFQSMLDSEIANELLQGVDGDSAVFRRAIAGIFARVGTDTAADRRKRIALRDLLPGKAVRLFGAAPVGVRLSDGSKPAPDIGAARAAAHAGREFLHVGGPQRADFAA